MTNSPYYPEPLNFKASSSKKSDAIFQNSDNQNSDFQNSAQTLAFDKSDFSQNNQQNNFFNSKTQYNSQINSQN